MKKTIALVLAIAAVLSLSVCAFAGTGSATGSTTSSYSTAGLPATTKKATATLTELAKEDSLTADQKATFEAAYADLANVAPEGYVSQYFCYAKADKYPVDVVMDIADVADVLAKLYANGAWQDLVCKVNGSKVTVTLPCEGALALFTK